MLDAAELCRNVHPDLAFKESAEQVFHRLSALIHDLNADEQVYTKVKEIHTLCTQGRSASGFYVYSIYMLSIIIDCYISLSLRYLVYVCMA